MSDRGYAGMLSACLEALAAGRACLHPSDTLPGLTFDPTLIAGKNAVIAIKERDEGKSFLSLVPHLEAAQKLWAPLPPCWHKALSCLWPGPLSVVWQASELAPPLLVSASPQEGAGGEIGLRVPNLPPAAAWLSELMLRFGKPLPTTSVNRSGEAACTSWGEAVALLRGLPVLVQPYAYIPVGHLDEKAGSHRPSTVIRIQSDGAYQLLREGAVLRAEIDAALAQLGR